MGSRLGVTKIAAKRVGLSLKEYQAKIDAGLKWCHLCKTWRRRIQFNRDKDRGDGLCAICIDCRRVKVRKKRKGFVASKKEKSQASSAISYEIKRGRMIHATQLPCRDCGKSAQEYHHHLGYVKSHWLDVIPLCKSCHVQRHWE